MFSFALLLASCRSLGSVWAYSRHGDVRVCVGSLCAEGFVVLVLGLVHVKFGVHVPSELLGGCHRVSELLLWLLSETIELCFEDFELLFSGCCILSRDVLLGCRFLGDGDH